MTEDYFIRDAIYLVKGEHCLDLHNDFDFSGVTYSVAERNAILSWHRSGSDWVNPSLPLHLDIVFHEVSRFHFIQRDPEMPFSEDNCLSQAGFWTNEEWCDGAMIYEAAPEDNWLRAFAFQSGAMVAILADEAKATIK